jgi:alkylated DNA repair dioxygenase AlkB
MTMNEMQNELMQVRRALGWGWFTTRRDVAKKKAFDHGLHGWEGAGARLFYPWYPWLKCILILIIAVPPSAPITALKSHVVPAPDQLNLFDPKTTLPEGFLYRESLISEAEETDLLRHIQSLPFQDFRFHGFTGKRRIVSFGWRYDFEGAGLQKTDDMPPFLSDLRTKAAAFAHLDPSSFQHVLVTEYAPGAGIGWHIDKRVFDEVAGISLLAPCKFRFRRPRPAGGFERRHLILRPRSAYLLTGPARHDWQHGIPPVDCLRYSITFRNFRTP